MWREFYQNGLKLNVIPWPAQPSRPQALGWFKKPLKGVADFKVMKCRQTGLNIDVWKGLTPPQREAVNSAIRDAYIMWITRWQKQSADAIEEMIVKHGTQIRRTPPDILIATLKAWDEVAAENSAKSPVFKKVYESQREYASKVVPAKRYMFPPYSFAANYYWPEGSAAAPGKKAAKK